MRNAILIIAGLALLAVTASCVETATAVRGQVSGTEAKQDVEATAPQKAVPEEKVEVQAKSSTEGVTGAETPDEAPREGVKRSSAATSGTVGGGVATMPVSGDGGETLPEVDEPVSEDDGETEEDSEDRYVNELIEQGDLAAKQGDSSRAAGLYQQAVNADPDNETARSRLSGIIEVVTMFGQPEEASKVMHELTVYAPDNPYYRYMYGRYMLCVGFVEDAYGALELAAAMEPGNPAYLTEFGNTKLFRGDLAGGLVDFEASLAIDPSYNMAYVKKAYVFIKTGSEGEARDILGGVVEREPEGLAACYAYALLGDRSSMLEQLDRLMLAEPNLKWFINSALEFEEYRQDPDFVETLN